MLNEINSYIDFSIEELDRELISRLELKRGNNPFAFFDEEGTPERDAIMREVYKKYESSYDRNNRLAGLDPLGLAKILLFKTCTTIRYTRGAYSDELMDCDEIIDDEIDENTDCVAAICSADSLSDLKNGFSTLKVKNYGETFNLSDLEPFRTQPIAAGRIRSGFLVSENIIATTAHAVDKQILSDIRFIFGFKMLDSSTAITQFPHEEIYRAKEILHRAYEPTKGRDWALVKLDRNVTDRTVASLRNDIPDCNQSVYTIGHPCGLPLKVVTDSSVRTVYDSNFEANLNIYSSNPGSPVIDRSNHEVIGMVARSENQDFRWTGNGWLTIPKPDNKRSICTRISEFINFI